MVANLRDLIAVGKVTAIFDDRGTIQITFEDKDDNVVEYPLLSMEYNMPKIEDPVWCIKLGNGPESGLCLGRAYDKTTNPPPVADKNIYHKPLINDENAFFEYDDNTKTMTLKADHIIFACTDAHSTGELSDKVRTMAADRSIYNGHTNGPNTTTPTQQM